MLLLGAGILLATLADRLVGGALGSALSIAALWGGMLAAIILAFVRSRPRMLLRFHPFDLLYGVVLGVLLRFIQGFLEIAGTGTAAWPTAGTLDGSLPASFWFDGVLAPVVIAPLLEEFFFRAVLLVAIFTAVRRMTNSRSWAGFAAITVTTLLFIGLDHALPKRTRAEASGWRNFTLSRDLRSGTWWSCCRRRCLSCCSGRARASSATSGSWRMSPVLWVMVGASGTIGSASTGHRVTHLHEPLLSGQARRAASP